MIEFDLSARYLAYLKVLNERRFDDLVDFVHEAVTYNDEVLTRRQYQDLLERDVSEIPDLYFDVGKLVVAEDQVACRLLFDCTPRSAFLGLPTNGRRIVFAEHVFYRFAGGRIAQVWSLIDRMAIERQLKE